MTDTLLYGSRFSVRRSTFPAFAHVKVINHRHDIVSVGQTTPDPTWPRRSLCATIQRCSRHG